MALPRIWLKRFTPMMLRATTTMGAKRPPSFVLPATTSSAPRRALAGRAGTAVAATLEPIGAEDLKPMPRALTGAAREREPAMADMFVDRACVRVRVVVAARARRPRLGPGGFFRFRHLAESRAAAGGATSASRLFPTWGEKDESSNRRNARCPRGSSGVFALFSRSDSASGTFFNFFERFSSSPRSRAGSPVPPRAFRPSPLALVARSRGGFPGPPAGVPPLPPRARRSFAMSSASTDSPPSAVSPSALAWEVATRVPLALLCARYAGFAFQRLRLPQISAHLLVGVLAGPHVSGLVGASLTSRLAWVDETCLAVIGVAAGSELRLAELRKNPRPTLAMVASLVVVTWVFVFTAFLAVGRRLAFLAELGPAHVVAVGSLVATLAVARSPASAIAILREMDARGPFCARVLEVTVVKDVVVVLLFALNLELVAISGVRFDPSTLDPRPLDDDLNDDGSRNLPGRSPGAETLALVAALARPAASLVGSVLAGGVAGVGLGHVLRLGAAAVLPTTAERGAPGAAPRGGEGTLRGRAFVVLRPALVLACSASAFLAASFARLEPLLLCVAAGAVAANRRHERGDAERRALGACVDAPRREPTSRSSPPPARRSPSRA